MYRRILLAYDGSREGRAALREGALLVKRLGAEAFLLAVVPALSSTDPMSAPMVSDDERETILREGIAKAAEIGIMVSGRLVRGEPVEEIKRFADEMQADLVIVGHRKRSLLERWWSGPSHAFLIDHLSCSLLMCQNAVDDETSRPAS